MKIILEVKKFKKLFCGLSCENFNIGSLSSLAMFFWTLLKPFYILSDVWRGLHQSLTAGKNFKITQHYYDHYKSLPTGI